MKRILTTIIFVALAVQAAASETISIRSDAWPPYNDDPKSYKPGYMITVLMEIFMPQGYAIDYQTLSWTESLQEVRKGKFNAVVGATKDDAPDFIFPKESFGVSDVSFFVKGGTTWKYNSLKDLEKIRLGVIESYAYNEEIDPYIEKNKGSGRIVQAKGDSPLKDLIRMLLAGEIDAIAEDTNVMFNSIILEKVPLGSIAIAGKCKEKSTLYIAFSPKSPKSKDLAAKFDAGITTLRKSGKLHAILGLYGLTDWK